MNRPTVIIMIGNPGSGKSTLLSQLGARTFPSGVRFRGAITEDVNEEEVMLYGQRVLLVDVPGLIDPRRNQTESNARKLTDALSRDFDFKLYFIMQASDRGPIDSDLVMMSKINECVRQTNGSRVSFCLIVNKIVDQSTFEMYQEEIAKDNCQFLFDTLDIPNCSFDIIIDSVMLLRFSKEAMDHQGFKDVLAHDVSKHQQQTIKVRRALQTKSENRGCSIQ